MRYLRWHVLLLALVLLFTASCMSDRRRGRSGSVSSPHDAGHLEDVLHDEDDAVSLGPDSSTGPAVCGNGVFEPGELCDPAITSGPGLCPTSCNDANSCTVGRLVGDANSCTAHCVYDPITECRSGDGCCPAGCTSDVDSDCVEGCGDGVLAPGESCDPGIESGPGSCPTSCVHSNPCLSGTLEGNASTCTARCVYTETTQCLGGDGCCPSGCTSSNDSDCASTCTPLTCAQAGVQCGPADNGCGQTMNCPGCPQGQTCQSGQCVSSCTPLTCSQLGVQCGSTDDGCGQTIQCPSCPQGQTCQAGQCVVSNPGGTGGVGAACSSAANCTNANAICLTEADFKNGYCTSQCSTDANCPSGSHCATVRDGLRVCAKTCTDDSQCRSDGYRCHTPFYEVSDQSLRECGPAATGTGAIGDACTAVWQCSGGVEGSCNRDWPGGYCTQSCMPLVGLCPTGSTCNLDTCQKECSSDANCRSGYSCLEVLLLGTRTCQAL